MKKRFLIVGDNHLDSRTPQSRIDNYMESSLMELSETLQMAKAVQADYYILLGDVFDRIEVGGTCRNRVIEILLSDDSGTPWPFKKYVVIGNHDIAHNPMYLEKSALGTLIASGTVNCVESIEELSVRFLHFEPELDEKLRNGLLEQYNEKIFFCHASIVDQPSRFEHVLFSDLKHADNAKLIVSGHIHSPMESISNKGVRFFNPGSLGRTKIDEKHRPQTLLIQYDYDNDLVQYKHLKLKSSLSHEIIFDIDKSIKKKTEDKNTELFIESVTNSSITDDISGDIEADFKTFALKRNVDDKVTNEVIKALNIIKTGGTL